HPPVRLRRLTVDLDLPAAACLLRLRSRPEEARDVEPDVEPHRVISSRIVNHRSRSLYRHADDAKTAETAKKKFRSVTASWTGARRCKPEEICVLCGLCGLGVP